MPNGLHSPANDVAGRLEELVPLPLARGLRVDPHDRIGARRSHEHPGVVLELQSQPVGVAHLYWGHAGDSLGVETRKNHAERLRARRVHADVSTRVAHAPDA